MPFLKPQHNFLRGVEIPTLAPGLKMLKFLGPCLDSRGDECRAAKKAHQAHEKILAKFKTPETEEDEAEQEKIGEKTLDIRINYAIASLKQQYIVALDNNADKDRGYSEENKDSQEAWKEAFSHYFTEDDIEMLMFSMQAGKYIDRGTVFTMAQDKLAPN